jgi:anthranilate phosphoribosyltransferase
MKYVGPIRKELGFRTVFNILGPLTNPAHPDFYLLGVYDQYLAEPVAHVLKSLGAKRALVVYGEDKLDEISGSAETFVAELRADGTITTYEIKPEDFGFTRAAKDDIVGGTPAENAEITRGILEGKITGPKRNVVCMNAGAALYAAGKAKTIEEGVGQAKNLIDSGAALAALNKFVEESNK